MMNISRLVEAEQFLQQAMDARAALKVFTPDDMGDVLGGIINDNRKMVAEGDVFAANDNIMVDMYEM